MGTLPQASPVPAGLASCLSVHTDSGYVCFMCFRLFRSLHSCVFTSVVSFAGLIVCIVYRLTLLLTSDYFKACYSDGDV